MSRASSGVLVQVSRVPWLPTVVGPALGILLFGSTAADDAFLSYWPAHVLAETGQILNVNGERVEQSSSLLLVLLLGLARRFTGLATPTLGPLLSLLGVASAVWLSQRLAREAGSGLPHLAGWWAATSLPLVYWGVSGMESALAASLGAVAVLATLRALEDGRRLRVLAAGAAYAAFAAIRPEGPFVLVAFLSVQAAILGILGTRAGAAPADRARLWRSVLLLIVAVGAGAGLVLFRLAYFGDWAPQPVEAKAAHLTLGTMRRGTRYALRHLGSSVAPLFALAALGAVLALWRVVRERPRLPELAVTLLAAGSAAFVVASGGDWMEAGRFLVPLVPLAAVLGALALETWSPSRARSWLASGVVAVQLTGLLAFAMSGSTGSPAWAPPHDVPFQEGSRTPWFQRMNRDCCRETPVGWAVADLVLRLRQRRPGPVVILSGQMGVVPWEVLQGHQGHVRFLDRYGLSSRDFTACAITEAAPRSAVGLLVPLGFFFHNLDALGRECGVPPPDVIVDLGRSLDPDLMRSQGYTVVYRQEGPVRSTSRWFPGRTFTADEFVAVRSALHDGSFPLRVRRFGPWEPVASVHSTGSRP